MVKRKENIMPTKKSELEAIYDSRASFYGKASLGRFYGADGGLNEYLHSYSTLVVEYFFNPDSGDSAMKINGWYSATTARHICEYLRQRGYHAIPKRRIEELAGRWFDPNEELKLA